MQKKYIIIIFLINSRIKYTTILTMPKTQKTLKTEAEFVKVFGFKPHGKHQKRPRTKKKQ